MSRPEDQLQLAQAARFRGQWSQADELFRGALQANDRSAQLHLTYGEFLAERQDFRPAIIHLMRAMDEAASAGDVDSRAAAIANLAAVFRQIGELDQARRFQRQLLAMRHEADAGDLLAWSEDAMLANKLPLAESLAESAFSLAEDAEDQGVQADCLGVLGLIAARRGELRPAVSLIIQAARHHRNQEDTPALGADYANLSEICGLLGRRRWQSAFLMTAWRFFQQSGMSQSVKLTEQRLRETEIRQNLAAARPDWN